MAKTQKISVVIPTYQESESIGDLVRRLKSMPGIAEVIVVDDGSTDATGERAKAAGASVHRHPYNMGNGAAVKSGIRLAKEEFVLLMDGDGQHDPAEIPKLLEALEEYDLVVGARSFSGQASVGRSLANGVYNGLASYVTQFPVKDLTSGFRVMKTHLAKKYLYLLPNTFSYPSTLTLAFLKSGHPVAFIPVHVGKRRGSSKISLLTDGTRFFLIILKVTLLFSPLRVFLPVSFSLFVLAMLNYAYTYLKFHRFTNMSALLLMTSALIFMMGLIAEQISMLRMDRSEDEPSH